MDDPDASGIKDPPPAWSKIRLWRGRRSASGVVEDLLKVGGRLPPRGLSGIFVNVDFLVSL